MSDTLETLKAEVATLRDRVEWLEHVAQHVVRSGVVHVNDHPTQPKKENA